MEGSVDNLSMSEEEKRSGNEKSKRFWNSMNEGYCE
jgi:hypothetical protein